MGKKLWPWQKGYKQEQEANLKAFEKAQKELDDAALSKSKEEGGEESAMGELEKALEEFSDLEKGHKESDGDENKDGKEKEGEEEGDEGMEKARREAEAAALRKSMEDQGLEAKMVAASIAFADLQKSQEDCFEAVGEGQELLAKAMATQTGLLLKLCGAMVEFKKGIDERLEVLGKAPAASSGHMNMSFRKSVDEESAGKDRTSVSSARETLQKAMAEGDSDVPMGILSKLDSTQDVGIIPQGLRDKFGIKA